MKKYKTFIILILTTIITLTLNTPVSAAEPIPVLDDTKDFSNLGTPTYYYEGDYIIESHNLTNEEVQLGKDLQEFHIHSTKLRHASVTAHRHSIKNIKNGKPRSFTWHPDKIWTANNSKKNGKCPTVSWTRSNSKSVSASISTSVGVTNSVVSASLESSYSKSHTVSTSVTRTFEIPYKKQGRIKVTYSRPCKTFTCVTTYIQPGPPKHTWSKTGNGSALGKPYNIVCALETRKN